MPCELAFHPEALQEWRPLSTGIREQFKKKLAERLIEPRIPASKLRGSTLRYKLKLLAAGFRLVDEVRDRELLVLVVAVGKRECRRSMGHAYPNGPDGGCPRRKR